MQRRVIAMACVHVLAAIAVLGALSCQSSVADAITPTKPAWRVFYISETPTGGSLKYIEDLKRHYSKLGVHFYRLPNKASVADAEPDMQEGNILIFQYLLNTDFTFKDVRNLVVRHNLKLIIPIHDKYFLNDNPGTDYLYSHSLHTYEAPEIPPEKLQLLHLADFIIFPSQFIHDVFAKFIELPTMMVVPHADDHLPRPLTVLAIKDNTYRVGIITPATYYKGADLVESLMHACPTHKGKQVRFFWYTGYSPTLETSATLEVRGGYNENDIYTKLQQDGVQGLLFLNHFPETYSYALTKGINTGLPILYTAIGAINERLKLFGGADKYVATNNTDIIDKFGALLDYIEEHARDDDCPKRCSDGCWLVHGLHIPEFYDGLFLLQQQQQQLCGM